MEGEGGAGGDGGRNEHGKVFLNKFFFYRVFHMDIQLPRKEIFSI